MDNISDFFKNSNCKKEPKEASLQGLAGTHYLFFCLIYDESMKDGTIFPQKQFFFLFRLKSVGICVRRSRCTMIPLKHISTTASAVTARKVNIYIIIKSISAYKTGIYTRLRILSYPVIYLFILTVSSFAF